MKHMVHHKGGGVNAITVRNLPPAVAKAVREKARREKLSLNKAVVRLLEEATGQPPARRVARHDDFEKYAGTWSREEADQFDACLAEMRRVDPRDWR